MEFFWCASELRKRSTLRLLLVSLEVVGWGLENVLPGGKRFTWGKGFPGGDCAVEGNNASFPGPVSQPLALLRSHWVGPNYFFAAVGQLILTVLVEITTFGITFSIAYWIMVLNEEIQYFINPFVLFCSVVLCVYMILFCKQSEC